MLKVTRCKFVHDLPCEQVSNRLTELESENAKLKELVQDIEEVADPYLLEFIWRRKKALGNEVIA